MSDLTKKQFFPRTRFTGTVCIPLRLTSIVAGLLLTMMPLLLTGCGGGGGTGGDPSVTVTPGSSGGGSTPPVGATASLAWSGVQDPSVTAYFVHYGRQSPGQPGSCAYESSISVDSPSATVTDLDPNTVYYFTVSAYNGLESSCSNEVSTVTPPASV
jgi:Fibronectin type III domain